jgi:hypothetical protein
MVLLYVLELAFCYLDIEPTAIGSVDPTVSAALAYSLHLKRQPGNSYHSHRFILVQGPGRCSSPKLPVDADQALAVGRADHGADLPDHPSLASLDWASHRLHHSTIKNK